MRSSGRPTLAAFDAESAALLSVLDHLETDDFDRPTNCPPWSLHELVVHIAFSIRTTPARFVPASEALPIGTAADYFRRPERDTAQYRTSNVDRTRSIAGTVARGEAPALFKRVWYETSKDFAAHAPTLRIEAGGRSLELDGYLLTRLMSVAAHGLDVAITLKRDPWTTAAALEALRPVLVDLLGADPPDAWTDRYLLEVGTGRKQLTEDDRRKLGPRASQFPLLS